MLRCCFGECYEFEMCSVRVEHELLLGSKGLYDAMPAILQIASEQNLYNATNGILVYQTYA